MLRSRSLVRLEVFRLVERLCRRAEFLELGLLALLPLRVRDSPFLVLLLFVLLYWTASPGDMGTGDDGDRMARGVNRSSFRPRASDVFCPTESSVLLLVWPCTRKSRCFRA